MDSLSFVFLSCSSWATARRLLGRAPDPGGRIDGDLPLVLLAAPLMTAIDLACDPISLQGDRWFLGRIYDYAERGAFCGIRLSNFAGWMFVAATTTWLVASLERAGLLRGRPRPVGVPNAALWAPVFWCSIVLFNVAIAFLIDLAAIGWLGIGLVALVVRRLVRIAGRMPAAGVQPARDETR